MQNQNLVVLAIGTCTMSCMPGSPRASLLRHACATTQGSPPAAAVACVPRRAQGVGRASVGAMFPSGPSQPSSHSPWCGHGAIDDVTVRLLQPSLLSSCAATSNRNSGEGRASKCSTRPGEVATGDEVLRHRDLQTSRTTWKGTGLDRTTVGSQHKGSALVFTASRPAGQQCSACSGRSRKET
eukprot:SAG22_NODE_298_length_12785_cov_5.760129_4_plen_183_part_00